MNQRRKKIYTGQRLKKQDGSFVTVTKIQADSFCCVDETGIETEYDMTDLGGQVRTTYGFFGWGRDIDGYDRYGFDRDGMDREGYDRDGFNEKGISREGYDRQGYDCHGRDLLGVRKEYAGFISFNLLDGRTLVADLHGFHYEEVKRIIEDLITNVREPVEVLKLIHGYSHGTVIRDYIREEMDHPRILSMERDFHNDGVTYIKFKDNKTTDQVF